MIIILLNCFIIDIAVCEESEWTVVTLLTDFGIKDGDVGVMKGAIWEICPLAQGRKCGKPWSFCGQWQRGGEIEC